MYSLFHDSSKPVVAKFAGLPSSLLNTPDSEIVLLFESALTLTALALAVQHTLMCPLGLVDKCNQGKAQKVLEGRLFGNDDSCSISNCFHKRFRLS